MTFPAVHGSPLTGCQTGQVQSMRTAARQVAQTTLVEHPWSVPFEADSNLTARFGHFGRLCKQKDTWDVAAARHLPARCRTDSYLDRAPVAAKNPLGSSGRYPCSVQSWGDTCLQIYLQRLDKGRRQYYRRFELQICCVSRYSVQSRLNHDCFNVTSSAKSGGQRVTTPARCCGVLRVGRI